MHSNIGRIGVILPKEGSGSENFLSTPILVTLVGLNLFVKKFINTLADSKIVHTPVSSKL